MELRDWSALSVILSVMPMLGNIDDKLSATQRVPLICCRLCLTKRRTDTADQSHYSIATFIYFILSYPIDKHRISATGM